MIFDQQTESEFVEFTVRIDVDDDDSGHDVEMGAYGPEAKISALFPVLELEQLIEEEGYPPSPEGLSRLIDEMQDFFSDKHGGCPEDVVQDHIWDTASNLISDWELDDDNEMS